MKSGAILIDIFRKPLFFVTPPKQGGNIHFNSNSEFSFIIIEN